MAKDPAFLFYSSDFMMGTALMSESEVGQYIRILCHMHQSGHLSIEDMKNICPNISSKVVAKFRVDDAGLYYNERLDAEVAKRKSYSESRRKNRLQNKKESYDITYVNHMTAHMENENRNENKDVVGIEKEVQGEKQQTREEIQKLVFADPMFLARLHDSHPGKDYEKAFGECYAYFMNRPNPPNMLWVWRQKLMTWLSNMKSETAKPVPVKKKSYQEFIKKA